MVRGSSSPRHLGRGGLCRRGASGWQEGPHLPRPGRGTAGMLAMAPPPPFSPGCSPVLGWWWQGAPGALPSPTNICRRSQLSIREKSPNPFLKRFIPKYLLFSKPKSTKLPKYLPFPKPKLQPRNFNPNKQNSAGPQGTQHRDPKAVTTCFGHPNPNPGMAEERKDTAFPLRVPKSASPRDGTTFRSKNPGKHRRNFLL